jgi:hypothetical protein
MIGVSASWARAMTVKNAVAGLPFPPLWDSDEMMIRVEEFRRSRSGG